MEDMTLDIIIAKTKEMLGENYREPEVQEGEEPDYSDLRDICEMVTREAAQWTNRYTDSTPRIDSYTSVMNDCWPVIVKCSCIAYLNKGSEGLGSQSELGQQNVYNDWVKLMHQQITNRRYVI